MGYDFNAKPAPGAVLSKFEGTKLFNDMVNLSKAVTAPYDRDIALDNVYNDILNKERAYKISKDTLDNEILNKNRSYDLAKRSYEMNELLNTVRMNKLNQDIAKSAFDLNQAKSIAERDRQFNEAIYKKFGKSPQEVAFEQMLGKNSNMFDNTSNTFDSTSNNTSNFTDSLVNSLTNSKRDTKEGNSNPSSVFDEVMGNVERSREEELDKRLEGLGVTPFSLGGGSYSDNQVYILEDGNVISGDILLNPDKKNIFTSMNYLDKDDWEDSIKYTANKDIDLQALSNLTGQTYNNNKIDTYTKLHNQEKIVPQGVITQKYNSLGERDKEPYKQQVSNTIRENYKDTYNMLRNGLKEYGKGKSNFKENDLSIQLLSLSLANSSANNLAYSIQNNPSVVPELLKFLKSDMSTKRYINEKLTNPNKNILSKVFGENTSKILQDMKKDFNRVKKQLGVKDIKGSSLEVTKMRDKKNKEYYVPKVLEEDGAFKFIIDDEENKRKQDTYNNIDEEKLKKILSYYQFKSSNTQVNPTSLSPMISSMIKTGNEFFDIYSKYLIKDVDYKIGSDNLKEVFDTPEKLKQFQEAIKLAYLANQQYTKNQKRPPEELYNFFELLENMNLYGRKGQEDDFVKLNSEFNSDTSDIVNTIREFDKKMKKQRGNQ